jgi:hypothetical protein
MKRRLKESKFFPECAICGKLKKTNEEPYCEKCKEKWHPKPKEKATR